VLLGLGTGLRAPPPSPPRPSLDMCFVVLGVSCQFLIHTDLGYYRSCWLLPLVLMLLAIAGVAADVDASNRRHLDVGILGDPTPVTGYLASLMPPATQMRWSLLNTH
jgi:hypothetical protein